MSKLEKIFANLPKAQVALQLGNNVGDALTQAFAQKRVVHPKGYSKTLSPLEVQNTWQKAEEVRKLAEQSALASKDIVDLINIIQRDTTQAVQAISAGKIEVETGSEVVNNAGRAFADIYQQIEAVNNQTQEINTLVENMFNGNSKILVAIEEINTSGKNVAEQSQNVSAATQELSATMEEIASSTDILAGLAVNLKSETSKFKI